MKTCNPLRLAAYAVALTACAATPALAKDSGFYLGVNVGESTYDSSDTRVGVFTIVSGTETDDTDLAFSVSFGYRLLPYVGAEISLHEFGDLETTETGFGSTLVTPAVPTTTGGFAEAEVGTRGASLAVVGMLPLGNFELHAKAGVMYAETKLKLRVHSLFGTLPTTISGVGSVTSDTTTAMYGAGIGYATGEEKEFVWTLDWLSVPKVAEQDDDVAVDLDVQMISLGFQYRF